MAKRCTICAQKLNDEGNCEKISCPAYIKAQIDKAAEESKKEEE